MGIKEVVYGCNPKKDKKCKCERIHTTGHKNGILQREDKLVCRKEIK